MNGHLQRHWARTGVISTIIATGMVVMLVYALCNSSTPDVEVIRWSAEMDRNPNNRRIFFHETSGRGWLNLRQTCAVESTAKHNTGRPIHVFIQTDELDYSVPFLSVLQHYKNVLVILLGSEDDYFRGTPFDTFYKLGQWRWSRFKSIHLSDMIRVLSLLKGSFGFCSGLFRCSILYFTGGGMYMDLDFITLKPLNEKVLWNFVPIEDEVMNGLTNIAVHMEHNHRLLNQLVDYLKTTPYEPDLLKSGPLAWSNVVSQVCGVRVGNATSNKCSDVKLLPHNYLNPLPYWSYLKYFQNVTDDVKRSVRDSYAVHLWNSMSYDLPFHKDSDQLFALLAAEHCPFTFAKSAEFFKNS